MAKLSAAIILVSLCCMLLSCQSEVPIGDDFEIKDGIVFSKEELKLQSAMNLAKEEDNGDEDDQEEEEDEDDDEESEEDLQSTKHLPTRCHGKCFRRYRLQCLGAPFWIESVDSTK